MRRIGRRGALAMGFFSLISGVIGKANAKEARFATVAEFRAFVIRAFKRQAGIDHVVADPRNPAGLTITAGTWSLTSDVTNLFNYVQAYPEDDVVKLVQRFINSALESRDRRVADDMIIPVIRHRSYVEDSAKRNDALVHEPYGADLVIVYMLDMPDSMSPITEEDLSGRDMASIRDVAFANARRWLPKVVSDDSFGVGVLYYVEDNTMLSTTLLLLDEFWASIAARFPGDVLIALPRKDQLFIFDDHPDVQPRVRRLIDATIEEGTNLLSPGLYARRGGKTTLVTT